MRWLAAGFALHLALGACRTASIHSPAVQMHLAVEPAILRSGETAQFEFAITNPRADTVVLEFGGDCWVTFMVLDESQRATGLHGPISRCVGPEAGSLVLPIGATWKIEEAWKALAEDGEPLLEGSYVIRAVLGEHYAVYQGKREYKLGHAADTIAIRVLPQGGK